MTNLIVNAKMSCSYSVQPNGVKPTIIQLFSKIGCRCLTCAGILIKSQKSVLAPTFLFILTASSFSMEVNCQLL